MKKWVVLGLVFGLLLTGKLGAQEKLSEAKSASGGEKGLVAYWSFDEGSKSIAKDYSGNGNDANINGAKIVDGMCGKALSIGSGNYAVCGGGLELGFLFPADYSLEVWVKQNSKEPQAYISKWTGSGGQSAWWLGYYEEVVQFGDYYEGGQVRPKGTDIADDQWHYLVGVREGTNLSLYIDGEKVAEGQSPGEVSGDNPAPVKIGGFGVGEKASWPFKGLIDEVRVYCRALTEKEIKERYELIKSGKKQATLEALPSEEIQTPLVFGVVEGKINLIYDKKDPIQFSVFLIADRPTDKKEEKKVLFLLTNEKNNIIDKTEKIVTLEKGERNKEVLVSLPPKGHGEYNLEVKIGDDTKMKKNIMVKDMDIISKENIKIREERKKTGNLLYRGIISAYAGLRYKGNNPDVDATISLLKDLGVNCYTHLIYTRSEKELACLPEVCTKAEKEGIEVWVYLVPPSEAPINVKKPIEERRYPPFDMDYLKWAEAVAKISVEHPNLTLWMIDDFDGNVGFFTLDYTREIYETSKKIAPKLLSGVCVYHDSIENFVKKGYLPYFDAVLWGYQHSSYIDPDCGISAKSLPLEINDYYKICPNKILVPCIYFSAHSSWPKGRPTKEYLEEATKIAYEQAGVVWVYCTPSPGNFRYGVVKNYINSITLEKWK